MVHVVVLACVLKVTTTKKVINFLEEKSAPPQRKSWPCLCLSVVL